MTEVSSDVDEPVGAVRLIEDHMALAVAQRPGLVAVPVPDRRPSWGGGCGLACGGGSSPARQRRSGKYDPYFTVPGAAEADDPNAVDDVTLIDELVREGARRMLAEPL